jgi:bifunctional pyridoxal-dependent enzyme with beta-cystathionase and maltose regulon repressor activities
MPESGIMSWLDISRLGSSEEVAGYLLKEAKILVNSGSGYGKQGEGHIRIITGCFYEDVDAVKALERIKTALTDLAKKKGII